jgi:hypothetical protein
MLEACQCERLLPRLFMFTGNVYTTIHELRRNQNACLFISKGYHNACSSKLSIDPSQPDKSKRLNPFLPHERRQSSFITLVQQPVSHFSLRVSYSVS